MAAKSNNCEATRKGGAKTQAQRKREQRQRERAHGIIHVSFKIHVDDKYSIAEFVKLINEARGI